MTGVMQMNVMNEIRKYAKRLPKGKPVAASSFMKFGNRASVDQALSRLVKEGVISRVGRGVYVRPKKNPYVGEAPPSVFEVAKAKAQGAPLQVSGAEAARRLGLSTQVPAKAVFLTSGAARHFKVGALEVELKHVSARKLILAGRPAGLALAAFWHLGKKEVTPEVVEKVRHELPDGEFEALLREKKSMPIWMQNVMYEYQKRVSHG